MIAGYNKRKSEISSIRPAQVVPRPWMGYCTSYIKLPTCPQETRCPPSAGLEEGYCPTGMVSGRWYLDTKGNAIKRYHKFSLNIPPKCRRENIFWVLARHMITFLISNQYLNTYVQKPGVPGFPGCLEYSQIIWNSILSARRDKTELHVMWLDLANAYGSVLQHLIRMTLEFFNFPSKVGEIIMKYFNSAFMKFTVKNYTTKWQVLEIGIVMGCVISPTSFHSRHGTHFTRCSKYVERNNEK